LGLAVLAVLRNGLTLSDMPSELAGILTGVLLLSVLAGEALTRALSRLRKPADPKSFASTSPPKPQT
jgi:ribose/xylose/arabinose/galactoside ABC-type transport system permease subunit